MSPNPLVSQTLGVKWLRMLLVIVRFIVHIVSREVVVLVSPHVQCTCIPRCNGSVTVEKSQNKLKLHGMEGAAMDYAIHGHAIVHIPLGQSSIDCKVLYRDSHNDTLLVQMPSEGISALPRGPVYVHFEINHNYFDGLHKAVNCLNQQAMHKLFPTKRLLKEVITGKVLNWKEKAAIKEFTLDGEYQMNALQRMISSDPRVPFLVLGPFGTGKTHILAAAASALLCDPNSHILICTYQHQCANSIYNMLYKRYQNKIMRLVPNQNIANHIQYGHDGVALMNQVRIHDLARKQVVVTTFLTATNLKRLEVNSPKQLYFSHILIDEGAQAREPESLGALAVVKEQTKIVIVGDHKQVSVSNT